MAEIDISEMKVRDVHTLRGAYEELGITKGRMTQLIAAGKIDYGVLDDVKLVPASEVERRKRENPGSGNPNWKRDA